MKRLAIVLLWVVIGCSKKDDAGGSGSSGGGTSGGDNACLTAIDKALASLPAGGPDVAGKLKGIYVKHCNEDKWPQATLDCYSKATGMQDIRKCRDTLPPDQAQKIGDEIRGVMMGMGGMGRGRPGGHFGSGGSGSAEGSAAGSASGSGSDAGGSAGSAGPAGSGSAKTGSAK